MLSDIFLATRVSLPPAAHRVKIHRLLSLSWRARARGKSKKLKANPGVAEERKRGRERERRRRTANYYLIGGFVCMCRVRSAREIFCLRKRERDESERIIDRYIICRRERKRERESAMSLDIAKLLHFTFPVVQLCP